MAKNDVMTLMRPVTYADFDSVCGCCRDLVIVGIAANPSLSMANRIAISGSLVIRRHSNPRKEIAPHT